MRQQRRRVRAGFTFIEVLVAMLIFTLAVLAAVSIADGATRATREARDISRAAWLLQRVMTELETKVETEGFDRGCEKKKEGKFEGPDANFTWITYCNEVDMRLSESAAQTMQAMQKGDDEESNTTKENVILKLIMDTASTYMTKALREIHAEVYWMQGKNKRKVDATTHVVRYDMPLQIPGLPGGTTPNPAGGAGTGTGTGTGTGGTTTGTGTGGGGT